MCCEMIVFAVVVDVDVIVVVVVGLYLLFLHQLETSTHLLYH